MDISISEFAKKIHCKGYKLTPQRKIILEVLIRNRNNPLTPEQVYRQVKVFYPGIGLTTVYRMLELLRKIGVVNHIHFHDSCEHYEINDGQPHHYLICLNCGRVERTNLCFIDKMQEIIKKNTTFKITEHCLSFFGYCRFCQLQR